MCCLVSFLSHVLTGKPEPPKMKCEHPVGRSLSATREVFVSLRTRLSDTSMTRDAECQKAQENGVQKSCGSCGDRLVEKFEMLTPNVSAEPNSTKTMVMMTHPQLTKNHGGEDPDPAGEDQEKLGMFLGGNTAGGP